MSPLIEQVNVPVLIETSVGSVILMKPLAGIVVTIELMTTSSSADIYPTKEGLADTVTD